MFAYRVCQRLRDELRNTRGSVRTLDIFFSSFLFFANLKSNFPPITRFKGSTSLTSFFFFEEFLRIGKVSWIDISHPVREG